MECSFGFEAGDCSRVRDRREGTPATFACDLTGAFSGVAPTCQAKRHLTFGCVCVCVCVICRARMAVRG